MSNQKSNARAIERATAGDRLHAIAERIRMGTTTPAKCGPSAFATLCHLSLPPDDALAFCEPHPAALAAYNRLLAKAN